MRLSAAVDLLTVLLVFLTAQCLYNRRVGLLAAAFYTVAVVPIQQSHFYTVDTFASFFMMLVIYLAVLIATSKSVGGNSSEDQTTDVDKSSEMGSAPAESRKWRAANLINHPIFWPSILFGLALGMAVASKINAAPIAVVLPIAAGLYLLKLPQQEQRRQAPQVFAYLVLAGLVRPVAFRVFQP